MACHIDIKFFNNTYYKVRDTIRFRYDANCSAYLKLVPALRDYKTVFKVAPAPVNGYFR